MNWRLVKFKNVRCLYHNYKRNFELPHPPPKKKKKESCNKFYCVEQKGKSEKNSHFYKIFNDRNEYCH